MEKHSCTCTDYASLISGKVTRDYEYLLPEEPRVYVVCLGNFEVTKLWTLKRIKKNP